MDSDLDSGYSQESTKRKRNTGSETCSKRKRCRIAIYDSSESENENNDSDKNQNENTHSDSDSGVNGNEVENDINSAVNKNRNKTCSESENESSKETETFEEQNSSRDNKTDESDHGEKNDSDSYENESSGETDSERYESESSSDTDSDIDSESNCNEGNIDKLKPKSLHSGSTITFKCPVCHFRCPSSGCIYVHMVKEHGAKKFRCEKCDFSTPNKTSLLNHIRCYCKGHGLKPKHFFTKRKVPIRQVKMLKQKVVSKKVLFFCQYCDHSGKSSGIVFVHMCKEHGIEPFKCSKCKFSTGNKTSFYNHITHFCR